jgi:hypothetical protein
MHVSVRNASASIAVGIAIGRLIIAAGGASLSPTSADRAASASPTPDDPASPAATPTVTPVPPGASGSFHARVEFDR